MARNVREDQLICSRFEQVDGEELFLEALDRK
jgi:hypothetical protein